MNTPLAIAAHRSGDSELKRLTTEAITTAAGFSAAAGMVAVNVLLQRGLDFDLLGLTLFFVLPVGAFYGGIAGASGYYFVARWRQRLPSQRMLFEMIAIALSTWLLMHWVEYASVRLRDGTHVRDVVSFWHYLRIRTEHLQFVSQNSSGRPIGTPTDLGLLGYAHEFLQIVGFLLGGLLIWLLLCSHEACTPCSRYAQTKRLLQRAPSAMFDEVLNRAGIVLPGFAQRVTEALGKRRLVGLNLTLATCPSCRRNWIRPAAVGMDGAHPVAKSVAPYDVSVSQAADLQRVVGLSSSVD
jgi:hypothetical protein